MAKPEDSSVTAAYSIEDLKPRRGRPKGSKNKSKNASSKKPAESKAVHKKNGKREEIEFPPENIVIPPEIAVAQNPSGIDPIEFKVLLREDETKNVTSGGIIIPDEAHEMERWAQVKGTIIAMSPAAFSYHNWPSWVRLPRVGDRVLFAKHSGFKEKGRDGVEYRMVNDKDIGAIINF